jgi:transcriptional regulator GlxA family with amidase domain
MPRHNLHQVQPYIEENLRSDLSLQAIADMAGMSLAS